MPPEAPIRIDVCGTCGAEIGHAHPYSWCSACGAPLPAEINRRLSNAYSASAVQDGSRLRAVRTPNLRARMTAVLVTSWILGYCLSSLAGFIVVVGLMTMVPPPGPKSSMAFTFTASYGLGGLIGAPVVYWLARSEWPDYARALRATVFAAIVSGIGFGWYLELGSDLRFLFAAAALPAVAAGAIFFAARRGGR